MMKKRNGQLDLANKLIEAVNSSKIRTAEKIGALEVVKLRLFSSTEKKKR